ncbi:MAG: hypothetical protein AB1631_24210, partial [Acidobacteriota bacterium]
MKRSRFRICLTLLVISQTVSIAQEKVSPSRELWLVRAERLTDDLTKEAAALSLFSRAMLFAGMGETWRETDKERARMFFNKAVELAKAHPGSESAGQNHRFATAHAVFSVLVRYDKAMSDELMKVFLSDQENLSEQYRNRNAQAMTGAATAFIHTDPQRALEFGLASIKIGTSLQLLSLIWNLSARDIKAAELLFKEALAAARSRNDIALLNILAQSAYQFPGGSTKKQIVSDRLCAEMLNSVADALLQVPTSRPLKSADCSTAFAASRLLGEVDRLLPARAAAFRETVARCQSLFPPLYSKETESYLKGQPLKTAEDYLKAAEESEDTSLRCSLQIRAARLIADQKDYERAINIIEGITPDDRNIDSWKSARRAYAGQLAIEHIHNDRIDQARQIIVMTPDDLQGSVYLEAASEMINRKHASAVEFIKEARRAMARADLSSLTLREYLSLVSLYGELLPA